MKETLKVALVQSALIWENPEGNRKSFEEKFSSLPKDVDLIVLPEMFTTGFIMTPFHIKKEEGEKTLQWMQQIAKQKDAAIVGSIVFEENKIYYNRLFFVKPDGSFSEYNKRHTFTLAGESKVYQAGSTRLLITYKEFKICPLICYDLRFPVWARNTNDYDVLLYVANWPKPRIQAWDTLLKARAIENMAYCIGVNRVGKDNSGYVYSGHSAVYDTLGEQLVFSEKEAILYVEIEKSHIKKNRDTLKFLQDQDSFILKE
ncbi:MAG: amidohydrolase [Cellulophaga sp.]